MQVTRTCSLKLSSHLWCGTWIWFCQPNLQYCRLLDRPKWVMGCTETFDIFQPPNMLFFQPRFFCSFWWFIVVAWDTLSDCHEITLSGMSNSRKEYTFPKSHISLVICSRSQVTTWCNIVNCGDGQLNVKLIKVWNFFSQHSVWHLLVICSKMYVPTTSTSQASQVSLKDNWFFFLFMHWEGFIEHQQHGMYITRQWFEGGMNLWNRKKPFIVKSLSL